MKKSEKSFDAVQMMRQIRDRLSAQCKEMTFEEQKQYIRERLSGKPTKEQPVASRPPPQHRAGPNTALEATGHSAGVFPSSWVGGAVARASAWAFRFQKWTDMPLFIKQVSSHGISNQIFARLSVQTHELIQFCSLSKAKKDEVFRILHDDVQPRLLTCDDIAKARLRD